MIDLESKVLGDIKAREVLGSDPGEQDLRGILEKELSALKDSMPHSKEEVEELIELQTKIQREVNSRPGAMALPQSKIRVFVEFSESYIKLLQERLDSL